MPAFNLANVITDPDSLTDGSEVTINVTNKTIKINVAGLLEADGGVTLKTLYSFLKEEWKANATYIKFPFPMTPITDEQFEFYNGWNLDKTGTGSSFTPNLVRTGGWAVKNANGVDTERWMCAITLGTLGTNDQVYYQQENSESNANSIVNIVLTDRVNQAIQFYSDADGNGTPDYNNSDYLKLYCREWSKTYTSSTLTDIGVDTLTYQAYRFPLTNTSDTKITTLGVTESDAAGNVWPYNEMGITWYANAQSVSGFLNPATAYFRVIINGDTAGNTAINPTAEQIYAFTQAKLRQPININDGNGSGNTSANVYIGKIVPEKLRFIGDDLYALGQTEEGVYIDGYRDTDVNRLHFYGYDASLGGNVFTNIQFPFTATLTLVIGNNLIDDGNSIFRVFFTNDDAGDNSGADYGTVNAILVNDKNGVPMANTIASKAVLDNGQWVIPLTYDYDGNDQRGSGSEGNVAPITVVAIGLEKAQYVSTTGSIAKSVTNTVSLIAPLERNYDNPN